MARRRPGFQELPLGLCCPYNQIRSPQEGLQGLSFLSARADQLGPFVTRLWGQRQWKGDLLGLLALGGP